MWTDPGWLFTNWKFRFDSDPQLHDLQPSCSWASPLCILVLYEEYLVDTSIFSELISALPFQISLPSLLSPHHLKWVWNKTIELKKLSSFVALFSCCHKLFKKQKGFFKIGFLYFANESDSTLTCRHWYSSKRINLYAEPRKNNILGNPTGKNLTLLYKNLDIFLQVKWKH